MKYKIIILITSLGLFSCQTSFSSFSHLPGAIGSVEEKINLYEFEEAGIPYLEKKIKLSLAELPFNKRNLRRYNKAGKKHEKLKIVDSLNRKPTYFQLEINDQIGLINAINSPSNKSILSYLRSTGNNSIVTSLKIYFPEEIASLISNTAEVYLVNRSQSAYALELVNKDKSRKLITFNEGTSFSYGFSDFCWKENYQGEAVIAAFREHGKSCPGITKNDPEKVHKKDVFEKF